MKCPICREPDLVMADRQGIEIDYCPQCRGVWLDRGELDKIIERTAAQSPAEGSGAERDRAGARGPSRHYDDGYREQKYRKKRRGLLGEIFDF